MATTNKQKIGWIGMGRMGFPMAERLIKAGHDVSIWNRTRAKAEPLAKIGGTVVDHLSDLKSVDVLFSIVATGKDVQDVLYGKNGVCSQGGKIPPIIVDCSTIAVEESATIRNKLKELGADFVAAPVSGNAKVIKAGQLSAVVSGVEAACKIAMPLIEVFAPRGVSYVGEGEFTNDSLDTFGGAGVARIPHLQKLLRFICERGFEHHVAANLSSVAGAVHEATTRYLGWTVHHHQ